VAVSLEDGDETECRIREAEFRGLFAHGDGDNMNIPKKGVGHLKHFLVKLFIGKRLLLSDNTILFCPRCKSKMKKLIKQNIEIDVCPYCNGMWLDDGEITKLNSEMKKSSQNKLEVKKNGKRK